MQRRHGILSILLAAALILALAPGTLQAAAFDKYGGQDGESTDDSHDDWIDLEEWPNPLDRPADITTPATKPGMLILPADKAGLSEPAMRPGTTSDTGNVSSTPRVPGATPGGPPAMRSGTTSAAGNASMTPQVPGATPGGPPVRDDGQHGDKVKANTRSMVPGPGHGGQQGVMKEGPGGKMQFFLRQGNSKVLAPDGIYKAKNGLQFKVSGGFVTDQVQAPSAGQTQAPSQLRIPGKMR